MISLGLIGYPLGHSLSPRIHAAALRSLDLEGRYSLFPVEPGDKQGLQDLLTSVRNGELTGLNVTIPHKQNVIPYLDELTPSAEIIGAVNTISFRDGRLTGENTDAPGFSTDLKRLLVTATQRREVPNALVLGAGGSARAVVYALLIDGWRVTLAARRPEQAEQLVESFRTHQVQVTSFELSNIDLSDISLIVNTTPVGMAPNIDRSPWPVGLPFPSHAAVYDLVYNPRETRLVQDARRQGLQATTGLGMLIEQAALSLNIWTGQNPAREIMRASIGGSPVSDYPLRVTDPGAS